MMWREISARPLDEVDRVDASSMAYHCRLCLGLQTRGGGGLAPATMNKCGHRICPECARGLLDDGRGLAYLARHIIDAQI
jgi:hypothetical protein